MSASVAWQQTGMDGQSETTNHLYSFPFPLESDILQLTRDQLPIVDILIVVQRLWDSRQQDILIKALEWHQLKMKNLLQADNAGSPQNMLWRR